MKASLIAIMLTASFSVFASEGEIIKSCSTVLKMPDSKSVETQIDIVQNEEKIFAIVTQNENSYEDTVIVETQSVRAGLNGDLGVEIDSLNYAEKLVTHAIGLTEDPIMEGTFSAGLDLRAVRSAVVYTVGARGNMGSTSIVEASDVNGKSLGSFLGGFLVSPCK